MKFILFFLAIIPFSRLATAQSDPGPQIDSLLQQQVRAWNQGDMDRFMQTYWDSDSLVFIGKSGIIYGWQATLDRYRKTYPGKSGMGKLELNIVSIRFISTEYCFVIGKWHLEKQTGILQGSFSLLIRKINGLWKIVTDHSS